jgi:hypothetical protein
MVPCSALHTGLAGLGGSFLRFGDLEVRAECAAGIDQGQQIVWTLAHAPLEQSERFIESILSPERPRPPKFGQIRTETGFCRRGGSLRCERFIPLRI